MLESCSFYLPLHFRNEREKHEMSGVGKDLEKSFRNKPKEYILFHANPLTYWVGD